MFVRYIKAIAILSIICWLPVVAQYSDYQNIDFSKNNRVALIIGNGDYVIGPLANPVNDARAMAGALKETGFDVLLYENVNNKDEFKKAVRKFGDKLRENGGVALFYYAGHGIQVNGINYLIPVNAEINTQEEVEYESMEVGFVIAQMESAGNRMNIVVLDACRNNPFARSFRSHKGGLATINAPMGTLIAYATAPGSIASDGTGKNGLYTEILLDQIHTPGLKIEEVFKNVRANVLDKSQGKQIPWESSSLIGDFYFNKQSQAPGGTGKNLATTETGTITKETNIPDDELLASRDMAADRWKVDDSKLSIVLNGKAVERYCNKIWAGDDMIIEHRPTSKMYRLRNYYIRQDGNWRETVPIEKEKIENLLPLVTWKASSQGYIVMIDNKDVSKKTTNTWMRSDLKVDYGETGVYFLLNDYSRHLDNQLRPAIIRLPGYYGSMYINAAWKATEEGYWFYLNGNEVGSKTSFEVSGDDLIVTYKPSRKKFLLKNYNQSLDDTLRKAIMLDR